MLPITLLLMEFLSTNSFSPHAPLQDEDVGPLDDSVPVHYYPEGEAAEAASAAVAIGASNKGFQLLQKMGWKGKGLGRKEDGEPAA
jgi:hypothetical protein